MVKLERNLEVWPRYMRARTKPSLLSEDEKRIKSVFNDKRSFRVGRRPGAAPVWRKEPE